jgi:hypothetical protein
MLVLVWLRFHHCHRREVEADALMMDMREKHMIIFWTVQNVCLLGCIGAILLSLLMPQLGLAPLVSSVNDLQQVSDMVENRINSGLVATTSLASTYGNLKAIAKSATVNGILDVGEICPALTESNSDEHVLFANVEEDILSGLNQIRSVYLDYVAATANNTLARLRNAAIDLDKDFDYVLEFAWNVKIVVALFVANTLFLILNLLFTRCSIDFRAYQRVTSFVILPFFCCLLVATLIGSGAFGMIALANAGKIMRLYLHVFVVNQFSKSPCAKTFALEDHPLWTPFEK